jgi:NADH-quinone oxidoreductase subunit J
MEVLVFMVVATVAVVSAMVVLLHKNPVIGALFLVTNLVCIAVLYLLLDAQFLAAIQVIVYAGAIMVLILFVIMLLSLKREEGIHAGSAQRFFGALAATGFVALIVRGILPISWRVASVRSDFGTAEFIGRRLFSQYFYPFEMISLVLLVAMAGAVVLAKKKL